MDDRKRLSEVAVLGIVVALLLTVVSLGEETVLAKVQVGNGILQVDHFSQLMKILFLLTTLAAVLFSVGSVEIAPRRSMEYNCFLLGLLSGTMFLVSAIDLMVVYLAFEMISLSSYVLAGFTRGDPRSAEAGYKYVIFGAVSSGVMLFGMGLLYGMTGSLNMNEIGARMSLGLLPSLHLMLLPIVFMLVGIGYKVAFFPFHYWAPDVYEGSPTPVTAFFSVAPKAAGFALFLRVLLGMLSVEAVSVMTWLGPLLAVVAALTMTLGNLAALNQENIKRMLAYSAIAHAGYMVMGLAVLNQEGGRAILFYLFAYLFTNLGAFTVIIALFNLYQTEQVDELTGMGRLFPLASACMAVCLFSLTGLPPTVGFVGKFYLFSAVIHGGYAWLAVVAALNTVVSLFYYMRIMKAFYFREPVLGEPGKACLPCGYNVLIAGLTVPVLFLGIFWSQLIEYCSSSISSLMIH
jgi:NADH-quinone oxidoreductase subunit N